MSVGPRLTGPWLRWDRRCLGCPEDPEVRLLRVEVRPLEEELEEADRALRCSLWCRWRWYFKEPDWVPA